MPATIASATAKLAELKRKGDSATGYVDLLEELLELIAGQNNVFGSSATEDIGTAEGDVPTLGTGGKLGAGVLPKDVDFGEVRLDARADADEAIDPRRAINAAQLDRIIRWAFTTSTTLFGDTAARTGGTEIGSDWESLALNDDASKYRLWVMRYIRPGSTNILEASLVNSLASGDAIDVSGETGLQYRQQAGTPGVRTLQFRTDNPGLRILSIRGDNDSVNQRVAGALLDAPSGGFSTAWSRLTGLPAFATRWPTFAEVTARPTYWGRGLHLVNGNTAAAISDDAARNASYIVVRGTGFRTGFSHQYRGCGGSVDHTIVHRSGYQPDMEG